MENDYRAFFSYVFETYRDCPYKVLASRNCSTLFEAIGKDGFDIPKGSLMTETGILARTDELAEHLKEHGKFPWIVLIDTSMMYGRLMSIFLQELEHQIFESLLNVGLDYDILQIQKLLSNAMCIEVFAYHGTASLLLPEYQESCRMKGWEKRRYSKAEFRALTYHIANFIADSDVVYSPYTMSARLPKTYPQAEETLKQLESYLLENGYSHINHNGMSVFQKYFPDMKRPSVVFTIRILQRKDSLIIAPYIFVADLEQKEFFTAIQMLDRFLPFGFRGNKLSNEDLNEHVRCELCAMMLNHLLLESVIMGAGLAKDSFRFDSEKIIWNFGGDDAARDFVNSFMDIAPECANDCLNEFLRIPVTNIFLPHISQDFGYHKMSLEETQDLLEEWVYKRSTNIELYAYRMFHGSLNTSIRSNGTPVVCIEDLFKRIYRILYGTGKQFDIQSIFACLLELVERGYIATTVRPLSDNEFYCHCIRVNDVSLSLMPEKYREYMSILIEMERYCLWGYKDMEWKIQVYFGDFLKEPELAKNLWKMADSVGHSGQHLCDFSWLAEPDLKAIHKYRKFVHVE